MAGLTKMKNIGWEEFKRVKSVSKPNKMDDDEVKVGPFLLECLYEAQDVQSCESFFGQHRVEFDSFSHTHTQIMVFMLLATVYLYAVMLGM